MPVWLYSQLDSEAPFLIFIHSSPEVPSSSNLFTLSLCWEHPSIWSIMSTPPYSFKFNFNNIISSSKPSLTFQNPLRVLPWFFDYSNFYVRKYNVAEIISFEALLSHIMWTCRERCACLYLYPWHSSTVIGTNWKLSQYLNAELLFPYTQ